LVRKLNVSLLPAQQIDYAFPLIRTVCPDATLESWRRFAECRLSPDSGQGSGILIVRNEQDCIVGVAAYHVTCDLLHGPVLFADPFCALDIVDQSSAARALERGIEKIARRHGCTAVHTTVASSSCESDTGWLCSILYERGHRVEGLQMCRLLPAVA
jgi:hypothetical protein